jgi:hypothetical protein
MSVKKIFINGNEYCFIQDLSLSYEEICNLAKPPQYSVTFSRGSTEKPEGILSKGQTVKVVDGMVIDCCYTGNA